MGRALTADDILPLVASLSPKERARLLRLIASPPLKEDAKAYHSLPPRPDEFSTNEDPLAWELQGWEGLD